MALNNFPDEVQLSTAEQEQVRFNEANAPWRAKYLALLKKFARQEASFFGTPHPVSIAGERALVWVYPDGSNRWCMDIHMSNETVRQVQCEAHQLRVLHDGQHVFKPSCARAGQNTQPVQPYHGAPLGAEGIKACLEMQAWLNPVLEEVLSLQ